MARRVSLPGADELFRTTGSPALSARSASTSAAEERLRAVPPIVEAGPLAESAVAPAGARPDPVEPLPAPRRVPRVRQRSGDRRPTGRERHDEKITVYVSNEELIDLEHARIVLRGEHGLVVDRGRIVREAVAMVLADLDENGESSIIVRRLREC